MHFASVEIGEIEACCHYLLHCSNYSTQKLDLLNSIRKIDSSILQRNNINITLTLLSGDNSFDTFKNSVISDTTINFAFKTRRRDKIVIQQLS